MKKQDQAKKLFAKAIRHQKFIDAVKPHYKELDKVIEKLIGLKAFSLNVDGHTFELIDEFKDKHKTFKAVSFSRFSVQKSKRVKAGPFKVKVR